MAIFRWEPPPNTGRVGKNRDSPEISGFITCCERFDCQVHTAIRLTVACIFYICFFFHGRRQSIYDNKPQRYAEDNSAAFNCTQWQIWSRSNNNERVRSSYCTVEANYWRTRSIARFLCDSRATCFGLAQCVWEWEYNGMISVMLPICFQSRR